jgi:hypothetical protein
LAATTEATTIRLYPKQLLRAPERLCVCDPLTLTKKAKVMSALLKLDDGYWALRQNLPEEVDHGAVAATSGTAGATVVIGDSSLRLHRCDHERLELIWR